MSEAITTEGSSGFSIRVTPKDLSQVFSSIQVAHLRVLDVEENKLEIWPCTIDGDDSTVAHVVPEENAVSAGRYRAELYIEAGDFKGVVGDPFSFSVRKILAPA